MRILKKISLMIIGMFLSLIILEFGLQTTSCAIKTIKNYKINKQLKNNYNLTILCLGESTTDGQWPPILQKILDKKSTNKKFNVIDAGKSGCNTNDIINNISNILLNHKVDIIVSMMGINDYDCTLIPIKNYSFKIFKLFFLIKKHLVPDLFGQEQTIYKESDFSQTIKKAKEYIYMKKYSECIQILENIKDDDLSEPQIIEKYNNLVSAYNYYIDCIPNYQELFPKIKQYILKVRKLDKSFSFNLYLEILIHEKSLKEITDLFHYEEDKEFENFINKNFETIMINFEKLKRLGLNDITQKIENNIYGSIYNNTNNIYAKIKKVGYVALNKFIEQDIQSSNKLFILQTKISLNFIPKQTMNNYIELHKICKNKKIKLIAMQYPMRNIKPLKKMVDFDDIVFISNEENFKQALKTHKIEEIFTDRFAGDFGHCTELGNTLIAENVAETILKLYN